MSVKIFLDVWLFFWSFFRKNKKKAFSMQYPCESSRWQSFLSSVQPVWLNDAIKWCTAQCWVNSLNFGVSFTGTHTEMIKTPWWRCGNVHLAWVMCHACLCWDSAALHCQRRTCRRNIFSHCTIYVIHKRQKQIYLFILCRHTNRDITKRLDVFDFGCHPH